MISGMVCGFSVTLHSIVIFSSATSNPKLKLLELSN